MKHIFLIISLIFIIFKVNAQYPCQGGETVMFTTTFNQCNNNPWVLVFEDNFNGNNLDLSRWQDGGDEHISYCNKEQQYYSHGDNIQISNGNLNIAAKKETLYAKAVDGIPDNEILICKGVNKGQNARYFYYTSGAISTLKKFSNGKFEARVKIPKGKGLWPAFWTYGGDPVANEIDIFEFMNENDILNNYDSNKLSKVHQMNLHHDYDADGDANSCNVKYTGIDFSQDFHTYTLIWDKNRIEWYVDGNLKRSDCRYYTMTGQETGCTLASWTQYVRKLIYPQNPMGIIFNLAIQGGLDENGNEIKDAYGNVLSPDATTPFPSQMEVDWVKYYQRIPNPCQDVTITNASQFLIDNQLFNAMVGRNVAINCTFTVLSGQQLDIVSGNSVILGPGFNAESGSAFNVRIESSVCN